MSSILDEVCKGLFATCIDSGEILMLKELPGFRSRSSYPWPRMVLDCDATAILIHIEEETGIDNLSTRAANKAIDKAATLLFARRADFLPKNPVTEK